jgi:hypothetical protein
MCQNGIGRIENCCRNGGVGGAREANGQRRSTRMKPQMLISVLTYNPLFGSAYTDDLCLAIFDEQLAILEAQEKEAAEKDDE